MTVESRIVEINKSAVQLGRLIVRSCGVDFFPQDVLGGERGGKASRRVVRLEVEGLDSSISTDFLSNSAGENRWEFRNSDWVKSFVDIHSLSAGDKLLFLRTSSDTFRVTPLWKSFTFIDLFAGIGGMRLGFEAVGGRCVFTSEIDSLAQDTYEANFGERPSGDITKINPKDIPDHDILIAGFPCQPFSIIGNRQGFADTRGTLYFNIERILEQKKPAALLLENVKQFRTHEGGRTCKTVLQSLKNLGYKTNVVILNALDFGVPQKRERTFIVATQKNVSFSFPKPLKYRPGLEAVLEKDSDVDPSLMGTEYIRKKRLERATQQGVKLFYPSMWHENKGGHLGIHPFSCALRHNASHNYLMVNGRRRPSGRECLRLQGYPETFKIVVTHRAIRAQAGNSVAVPVIKAIASRMMVALRRTEERKSDIFPELLFAVTS